MAGIFEFIDKQIYSFHSAVRNVDFMAYLFYTRTTNYARLYIKVHLVYHSSRCNYNNKLMPEVKSLTSQLSNQLSLHRTFVNVRGNPVF